MDSWYVPRVVMITSIIGMTIIGWLFVDYMRNRAQFGYVRSDMFGFYTKALVTVLVAVTISTIGASQTTFKTYSAKVVRQSNEKNFIDNIINPSDIGYVVRINGSNEQEFIKGSKEHHSGDIVEVIKISEPILGDSYVFKTDL